MAAHGRGAALLGRFRRGEAGAVAIMSALLFMVFLSLAALTVDFGLMTLNKRRLQGVADLAAIAATQDMAHATSVARSVVIANGVEDFTALVVTRGRYAHDPELPVEERFTAEEVGPDSVEVRLSVPQQGYFAQLLFPGRTYTLSVAGVASRPQVGTAAAISIGSRLARLDGGLANALLGALLGTTVSLTLMDYEALLAADLDAFAFLDALRFRLDLTGATYDEVLSADTTFGDVLAAMAAATSEGAAAVLTGLGEIPAAAVPNIALGDLLGLGPYAGLRTDPGLAARIGVMDLLVAAAALADGDHQAALALGGAVPGIADLAVTLTVGERVQSSPWIGIGEAGIVVRTVQTRLDIDAALGTLPILGSPALRLPLTVEVASGEARVTGVACGASGSVSIAARPGVTEAWIGDWAPGATRWTASATGLGPAALVTTPVLSVTGRAHVYAGNAAATPLLFTAADILSGATRTVHSGGIVSTAVASLLADLQLGVRIDLPALRLALGDAGLTALVAGRLTAAAAPLDGVVNGLLGLLGVRLGEAEVSVLGLHCVDGRSVALVR